MITISHLIAIDKVSGASNAVATLNDVDLSNIAQRVWEYLINADYEAGNVMTLLPLGVTNIRTIKKEVAELKSCTDEIKQMIKPILPFVQQNARNQLRGGKNGNK